MNVCVCMCVRMCMCVRVRGWGPSGKISENFKFFRFVGSPLCEMKYVQNKIDFIYLTSFLRIFENMQIR